MVADYYMLNKALDKETIDNGQFDNTKILVDTDDKLQDDITLNNVILMTCAIKDDGTFYPQVFLVDELYV